MSRCTAGARLEEITVRFPRTAVLAILVALAAGCEGDLRRGAALPSLDTGRARPAPAVVRPNEDSARVAFGTEVMGMLLDTHVHEIRGHLAIKVRNPNRDDESPLADRDVPPGAPPGSHTYLGVLHADLAVLRSLLGSQVPMTIEGERILLGEPAVAIDGHRHGDALYVPVKTFARQYGAYVRINCPLANCGAIWTSDILTHMRSIGFAGAPGVLEAHGEGLIDTLDVRAIRFGG